ncbi:Tubulin beta chain [Camelus dromedarius]|uniref:Tubulin beta chain n=1 Tax=Camelus dromedarius TaxID=9838 RepID=A0A5N4CIR0_CAMDR|nr:Tubulin beta chain [Camelus dromedarius]
MKQRWEEAEKQVVRIPNRDCPGSEAGDWYGYTLSICSSANRMDKTGSLAPPIQEVFKPSGTSTWLYPGARLLHWYTSEGMDQMELTEAKGSGNYPVSEYRQRSLSSRRWAGAVGSLVKHRVTGTLLTHNLVSDSHGSPPVHLPFFLSQHHKLSAVERVLSVPKGLGLEQSIPPEILPGHSPGLLLLPALLRTFAAAEIRQDLSRVLMGKGTTHAQNFRVASTTSDAWRELPYCEDGHADKRPRGEAGSSHHRGSRLPEGLLDLVREAGVAPMAAATFSTALWPVFLEDVALTSAGFSVAAMAGAASRSFSQGSHVQHRKAAEGRNKGFDEGS